MKNYIYNARESFNKKRFNKLITPLLSNYTDIIFFISGIITLLYIKTPENAYKKGTISKLSFSSFLLLMNIARYFSKFIYSKDSSNLSCKIQRFNFIKDNLLDKLIMLTFLPYILALLALDKNIGYYKKGTSTSILATIAGDTLICLTLKAYDYYSYLQYKNYLNQLKINAFLDFLTDHNSDYFNKNRSSSFDTYKNGSLYNQLETTLSNLDINDQRKFIEDLFKKENIEIDQNFLLNYLNKNQYNEIISRIEKLTPHKILFDNITNVYLFAGIVALGLSLKINTPESILGYYSSMVLVSICTLFYNWRTSIKQATSQQTNIENVMTKGFKSLMKNSFYLNTTIMTFAGILAALVSNFFNNKKFSKTNNKDIAIGSLIRDVLMSLTSMCYLLCITYSSMKEKDHLKEEDLEKLSYQYDNHELDSIEISYDKEEGFNKTKNSQLFKLRKDNSYFLKFTSNPNRTIKKSSSDSNLLIKSKNNNLLERNFARKSFSF